MRLGLFVAILSLLAGPSPDKAADGQAWQPTMDQILALEKQLQLPQRAAPLHQYERYYTGSVVHGHKVIVGQYLQAPLGALGGIYLFPSGLQVSDGGCSNLAVRFDTVTQKFAEIGCNGLA